MFGAPAWRHGAVALLLLLAALFPGCRCRPVDESDYQQGVKLFLGGQHASAEAQLRSFIAQHPSAPHVPEAQCLLGSIALGRRQPRDAEACFQACLSQSPNELLAESARIGLARALYQGGQFRQCRAACLELLQESPSSARADEVLFLLAEASDRLGMAAEARVHYQELAGRFPSSPLAETARARADGGKAGPTVSPSGTYIIQVAALSSAPKAEEHARLLRDRSYPARVAELRSAGSTLYAVQVGPYATKGEAERVAARLRAEGFDVLIRP